MSLQTFHRKIVTGQVGVLWALARFALGVCSKVYGRAIDARNKRFDSKGPEATLSVPVICVGNITTGGTGKTPFVIELARRLQALGRKPAVVSRGYGAAGEGLNDEQLLIHEQLPEVALVTDPDRIRAARAAVNASGADVIVLDDGFQHRRLGRCLDIVLIDATCPFGLGHLLPRGFLREPLSALRRAHLIVVTRSDQIASAELETLTERLSHLAPDVSVLRCVHRALGVSLIGCPDEKIEVEGKRVFLTAGIGNPNAFFSTARSLGAEVVGHYWWPDHHGYRPADLTKLATSARKSNAELVLTTEKDAVKITGMVGVESTTIGVLKIAIDFDRESSTMLQSAVEAALARS